MLITARSLPFVILLLVPLRPASTQVELRYKPVEGAVVRFHTKSSLHGNLTVAVGDARNPVELAVISQFELAVHCVRTGKGSRDLLELEVERLKVEQRHGGYASEIDSGATPPFKKDDALAPLYREYLKLVGRRFPFELGAQGRPTFTARARNELGLLGGPIKLELLELELSRLFPPLPEDKKKAKDTWTWRESVVLQTIGDVDLETKAEITRLDGDDLEAKLSFLPRIETGPDTGAPVPSLKIEQSSGTLVLDRKSAFLKAHTSGFVVKLHLKEQDLELGGDIRMGSEIRRIGE